MAKHSSDTRSQSSTVNDSFEYDINDMLYTQTFHCTFNNEFEMTKSNFVNENRELILVWIM